jgi:hypothetical protein
MALSKSGLKGRIESQLVLQGFTISGDYAYASKMATAIANAVIDEIVANSELVPITTDQGTAGAGIITGSVK